MVNMVQYFVLHLFDMKNFVFVIISPYSLNLSRATAFPVRLPVRPAKTLHKLIRVLAVRLKTLLTIGYLKSAL